MAPRNATTLNQRYGFAGNWGLKHELLSREEEIKLAILAKKVFLSIKNKKKKNRKAHAALQRLVVCNQRMVASVVCKFRSSGKDLDDLMGYGNAGLLIGIRKFDPKRGLRLGTYVSWWVRSAIFEFIRNDASPIRIPTSNMRTRIFYGLGRARQQLEREGKEISMLALAEKLGVPEKLLTETLPLLKTPLSFDAYRHPDDKNTLGDYLPTDGPTPEEAVADAEESHQHRQAVHRALACLNPRERRIIQARYLGDGQAVTLAEVARELGLCRERIRQIENEAKQKLARALKRVLQ